MILDKFYKVCINSAPCRGENGYLPYRHPELNKMSEQAYDKGESWFYYNDVDGHVMSADPEYRYKVDNLTEDEYQIIKDALEGRR